MSARTWKPTLHVGWTWERQAKAEALIAQRNEAAGGGLRLSPAWLVCRLLDEAFERSGLPLPTESGQATRAIASHAGPVDVAPAAPGPARAPSRSEPPPEAPAWDEERLSALRERYESALELHQQKDIAEASGLPHWQLSMFRQRRKFKADQAEALERGLDKLLPSTATTHEGDRA